MTVRPTPERGNEPDLDAITRRAENAQGGGWQGAGEALAADVLALVGRVRDAEADATAAVIEGERRIDAMEARALAAEARVAQLETALEQVAKPLWPGHMSWAERAQSMQDIARAALVSAGQGDTP